MSKKNENKLLKQPAVMCSCGRELIPCFNVDGKRIGVTHTPEDEDWHFDFWSTEKVIERIKSN